MFQAGDILVTGASAPVWGYLSELERTMFVGEPSREQERMFAHMVELQGIAFAAIRPELEVVLDAVERRARLCVLHLEARDDESPCAVPATAKAIGRSVGTNANPVE